MAIGLDLRRAFRPVEADGRYTERLREAVGESDVYAILCHDTREVLYIGESHTGRLFDTLTRHFRNWRIDPKSDSQGRRRGGTTYDRERVLVAIVFTEAEDAQDVQEAEIARLDPRDNTNSYPPPAPF